MSKMAVPHKFEDLVYFKSVHGESYRGISAWLDTQCGIFASYEAVRSCVRRVRNQRAEQNDDLFGSKAPLGSNEFRLLEIDRNLSRMSLRATSTHEHGLALRAEAHRATIAVKLLAHERMSRKAALQSALDAGRQPEDDGNLREGWDDATGEVYQPHVDPPATTEPSVQPCYTDDHPPAEVPLDERADHYDEGPRPLSPAWRALRGVSMARQREKLAKLMADSRASEGITSRPVQLTPEEQNRLRNAEEEEERANHLEKEIGLREIPLCQNPETHPEQFPDDGLFKHLDRFDGLDDDEDLDEDLDGDPDAAPGEDPDPDLDKLPDAAADVPENKLIRLIEKKEKISTVTDAPAPSRLPPDTAGGLATVQRIEELRAAMKARIQELEALNAQRPKTPI